MNFVFYTKINSAFIPNYLKNFFRTRIVKTFNILKSIFQNSLILAQAVYYHKYLHLMYINRMSILFNFSIFSQFFAYFIIAFMGVKNCCCWRWGISICWRYIGGHCYLRFYPGEIIIANEFWARQRLSGPT